MPLPDVRPLVEQNRLQLTLVKLPPRNLGYHDLRGDETRRERRNRHIAEVDALPADAVRGQAAQHTPEKQTAADKQGETYDYARQIPPAHPPIAAAPALPIHKRKEEPAFIVDVELSEKQHRQQPGPCRAPCEIALSPYGFSQKKDKSEHRQGQRRSAAQQGRKVYGAEVQEGKRHTQRGAM